MADTDQEITEPVVLDSTARKYLGRIATANEAIAAQGGTAVMPQPDPSTGLYDRSQLAGWFRSQRDGKVYGFDEPLNKTVAITKTDANAGIAAPTPYTLAKEGVDTYAGIFLFAHFDCDARYDGSAHEDVRAFSWDGFDYENPAYDVMVAHPTHWVREWADGTTRHVRWCDSPRDGYLPEAGAVRPDGTVRAFVLESKYPMDASLKSRSNAEVKRFVSHDTLVSLSSQKGGGYIGLSHATIGYLQDVFAMTYGTKNSQSVYAGCTGYTTQCQPTVAETGVHRVIVTTANASGLVVGSAMMLGSAGGTSAPDRGSSKAFDKFAAGKITRIEKYDDANSAVYFEEEAAFDVATTDWLSTTEWRTGSCDGLAGDGSPTSPTSGKEPFTLRGIELMHGGYETSGDLGFDYREDGAHLMLDRTPASGKFSTGAVDLGLVPTPASEGWTYPLAMRAVGGTPFPVGTGGSQSTGNCDGWYMNKLGTIGTREFRAFGSLGSGGGGGLRCCDAGGGLSNGWWYCVSRFSGRDGRGGESAA